MNKITKTFKSGNSVAVRLPAALGVKPGTEVRVREEQGRYIVEPVEEAPDRIDLGGIFASVPGPATMVREPDDFEDLPRDWHLLGLDPR